MEEKGRAEMENQILELLQEIQIDVGSVKGRLDQIDKRLDKMDSRLEQMDIRLTKLEDKSDMIIKHMVTRDEIAAIKNELDQEKQTTTAMAKDIYQVKSEVLLIRESQKIPT